MNKFRGVTKRISAMLLSGMLIIGSASGSVFASEMDTDPGEAVVEEASTEEVTEEDMDTASEQAAQYYTVTLDANGGYFANEWDDVLGETVDSTEVLSKNIPIGEAVVTFPAKEQENAVVTFMGWSLERDGEIVSPEYEEYTPVENCILYAVWNVDEISVESESSAEDVMGEDGDNQDAESADVSDDLTEESETDTTQESEVTKSDESYEEEDAVSDAKTVPEIEEDGNITRDQQDVESDQDQKTIDKERNEQEEYVREDAAMSAVASGTCGKKLTWTLDNEGTLKISGTGEMYGYDRNIDVPWHSYKSSILNVIIEEGVTSIGENAFANCNSLTSVTIPSSVESIWRGVEGSFSFCSNLESFTVDSGNTVYTSKDGVLYGCNMFGQESYLAALICYPAAKNGSYNIPDGVYSIDDYAFYGAKNLTDVTIPSSVSMIKSHTFSNSSITNVSIPPSIKEIQSEAFSWCDNLTRVSIPSSVKSIGSYAFNNCINLTDISVDSENANYSSENGVLFNKDKTVLICCPEGISGDYSIPESVNSIEYRAFEGCSNLINIKIPESVTSIGKWAFRKCGGLKSVNISSRVTMIEYATFDYCNSLTTIIIPSSVTKIRDRAFQHCSSLTSVVIPLSVTCIEGYVFDSCTALSDIYYTGSEDQWHLIDIDTGTKLDLRNVTIHFNCGIRIILNDNDKIQSYSGKEVKPIVTVKDPDGKTLTKSTDYTLSYSNNIEPGTATITATGLGDYAGQTASVTFEIVSAIIAKDAKPLMKGYTTELVAVVTSDTSVKEGDVRFLVECIDPEILTFGTETVEKIGEKQYKITRNICITVPGLYIYQAIYKGYIAKASVEVLDYETKIEIGPRLKNGNLARDDQEHIVGCCDVRFVVTIKKEGDSGSESGESYGDVLKEYLDHIEYNKDSTQNIIECISEKSELSEDGLFGERVIRVKPVEGIDKTIEILFKEENGKKTVKELKISDGIKSSVSYRADTVIDGKHTSVNNSHKFYYSDDYFYKDSSNYNNNLAVMSLGMAMAGYSDPSQEDAYKIVLPDTSRSANIIKAYNSFLFEKNSISIIKYDVPLTNAEDSAAFTIGTRYIASQEKDDTLIAVVIRGGGYGGEWASNFNVGEDDDSKGFRESAKLVYSNLQKYIETLKEKDMIVGDVKLWITGFSRSAAVANLVSHMANQAGSISGVDVAPARIYAYTYATPFCHYGDSVGSADSNIFNVISEIDLVPRMPLSKWGFSKYGQYVVLPENTAESVIQQFRSITGQEFVAKNDKNLEDFIVNLVSVAAPSRYDYVKYLQEHIVKWEKRINQLNVGNFVWGIGLGIGSAYLKDKETLKSKGILNLPEKIELVFGRGFRALSAAEDVIEETDFSKIKQSDTVIDFVKAHYPEHYLSWLETGGMEGNGAKKDYVDLSKEEIDEINQYIASNYVGNTGSSSKYTEIEIDGAYDISVLNPNEVMLAQTVAGMKGSNAASSGSVTGKGADIFYSEETAQAIIVLNAEDDYLVQLNPSPLSSVALSIAECDAEDIHRSIIYADLNKEGDKPITLRITRSNSDDGIYEINDSSGKTVSPIYDSRKAEKITVTLNPNGGYFNFETDDETGKQEENAESIVKKVEAGNRIFIPSRHVSNDDKSLLLAGWSLEKGGEIVAGFNEEYIPSGDCTLYALWKQARQTGIWLYGDVNENEKIDIGDSTIVLRHQSAVKNEAVRQEHPDWVISGFKYEAADINHDGYVTEDDALLIQQHIAASNNDDTAAKHPDWIITETFDYYSFDGTDPGVVTGITLNNSEIVLEKGKSATLTADVIPEDADDKSIAWSSSNAEVATVDENGSVKGVSEGTAIITAAACDGSGVFTTCEVTVTIPIISFEKASVNGITPKTYTGSAITQKLKVNIGDTILERDIDYTVVYSNNTNAGTATVTIIGKGNYTGTKTATFKINKAKQSITAKASAASIAVGKTATVSITGAKGTKSYKSSDTSIATVNASTGVVTGKKAGTVTITATSAATSNYNAASKTVKITVTAQKKLKKPGNCHFTKWNNAKYTSCRISWNKVDGADGYQTLLSWTNGSNASQTIVKSNVLYRDCTVHPQHVSQMKVRAFYTSDGKRVFGPWSNVEYITPSPTTLTTTNASAGSNLKMNIKWNIIYGCNGFNVFITTNPNGKWYWNQSTSEKATATSASIVKCGGAKLKKNTRYYVRIVTRRKRNGVFCTVPMPANNTYIGSFVIK